MYFRQTWHDDRLSFVPEDGLDKLVLNEEIAQKLWMPDTFFVNAKSVTRQQNILTGSANQYFRVASNGTVLVSKMYVWLDFCEY